MGRRFWRRASGVTHTEELSLLSRVDGPAGVALQVEVSWSPLLAQITHGWADYTVAVAAHWLDRTGSIVGWDGPRAIDPVDLRSLPDAPQTRWLRLGDAPAGATAVSVELVAEGLQWGSEAGFQSLVIILAGRAPTLPPRMPGQIGGGEDAQASPAAITPELRLAEVITAANGVSIDIEVAWSTRLAAVAADTDIGHLLLTARWLDGAGVPLDLAAVRSAGLRLDWLPLAPQVRRIHVGPAPPGGRGIAIELAADTWRHGPDVGIEALGVTLDESLTARMAPPRNRAHGPAAPDEPPGVTRAWLTAAFPEDANPEEMAAYVGADLARFLMSVQLMGETPGRILEIGSNPYFISRLITERFPDAPLAMTNYFGSRGERITQRVVDEAGAEVASFTSELVDTEVQSLPYGDESFDTVLLCEVIEHLVQDPVFQLSEIARVLRPGGRLVLTTPNVARQNNRLRLAQREGIYDPYSQYGPHGRHNREYTADELFGLVSGIGFTPVTYLTRPVHSVPAPDEAWFRGDGDDGAGDYHFLVLERNNGLAEPRRPDWLYR